MRVLGDHLGVGGRLQDIDVCYGEAYYTAAGLEFITCFIAVEWRLLIITYLSYAFIYSLFQCTHPVRVIFYSGVICLRLLAHAS